MVYAELCSRRPWLLNYVRLFVDSFKQLTLDLFTRKFTRNDTAVIESKVGKLASAYVQEKPKLSAGNSDRHLCSNIHVERQRATLEKDMQVSTKHKKYSTTETRRVMSFGSGRCLRVTCTDLTCKARPQTHPGQISMILF